MPKPGDVVVLNFAGAISVKRRPGVVISSDVYHLHRPDVIVGLITSNIGNANSPTDFILQDWNVAGLRIPSAFRSYFVTLLPSDTRVIGKLSIRDWQAVRACVLRSLG